MMITKEELLELSSKIKNKKISINDLSSLTQQIIVELIQYKDRFNMNDLNPVGINGFPTGYDNEGNYGEFIGYKPNEPLVKDINDELDDERFFLMYRRNDQSITEAQEKLCEQVWYTRALVGRREDLKCGKGLHAGREEAIIKIEAKYTQDELLNYNDDFEWGMINGKLSALRWAMGNDWDNLDT